MDERFANEPRHTPRRMRLRRRCAQALVHGEQARVLVFCLVMVGVFFLGLLLPLRPTVSELEKRELTEFPQFTWEAFWSGDFFKGVETWYADTFPFREQLLSLNQQVTRLYGIHDAEFIGDKIHSEEIPVVSGGDSSDYISPTSSGEETAGNVSSETTESSSSVSSSVSSEESSSQVSSEEPISPGNNHGQVPEKINSVYLLGDTAYGLYGFSQSASQNYAAIVNMAADKVSGKAQVYSIIVPISYSINLDMATQEKLGLPSNADAIRYMYANMNSNVKTVSIYGNLAAHCEEYLYFRTDHHWTALGAYRAYEVFCNVKGLTPNPLSFYETVEYTGFLGTMYSACNSPAAMAANPDTVIAYKPRGASYMTAVGEDGNVFDWPIISNVSDWAASSKYSCFAAADQAFETIHNENITDGSAVLVVQDSFGNAFVPFLVDHYEYVYTADPRYCEDGLATLVERYGIQDVVFVHNISTTGSGTLSGYVEDFVNK